MTVPLLVWPMTTLRTALCAWWEYGRYMLCLYALGAVMWIMF